jgi:hypothetical protein
MGEEAPAADRNNMQPRLGFLSYNTMMTLKRRKSRKRISDSAEWLYPIPKTEGLEAGENNKMQTRTKYTLEAVPPCLLVMRERTTITITTITHAFQVTN